MSVSLLVISHHNVGDALVNAAKATFGGQLPLIVKIVNVGTDADPDHLLTQVKQIISEINHGDGVLILTDLFGSTPSNIAHKLQDTKHCHIVSGLNLPMLIRVFNYPECDLNKLTDIALQGGLAGIRSNKKEEEGNA
jgi:mannose PTS system EIIA component